MRILFISTERPEPGFGAGERSLSICKALARIGELHTLVVIDPGRPSHRPEPGAHVVHLRGTDGPATSWYWRRRKYSLADYRTDRNVADAVEKLHREHRFDLFFGRYQLPILAGCARLGPTWVDLDDVPINLTLTRPALLGAMQATMLRRSLAPMRRVFVTKRGDVARISHSSVVILPCISTQPEQVDGSPAAPAASRGDDGPRLLFVGGMRWPPNREGVAHFIERVLPKILARVPGARLRLVGEAGEFAHGEPGVEVVGFSNDLVAEYRRAALVVVPIRAGAGSCVKLAEAAGFGRPIVSTKFAALGYEGILEPGRDLVAADDDGEFADRCVALLQDPARGAALGAAAKAAADRHLSQPAVDRIIGDALRDALRDAATA
jgi:glycosyltransferase involved in cell wall biosynthesis